MPYKLIGRNDISFTYLIFSFSRIFYISAYQDMDISSTRPLKNIKIFREQHFLLALSSAFHLVCSNKVTFCNV